MVRFITFLLFLIIPFGALAQTVAETSSSTSLPQSTSAPQSNENSLLQEQAAICASYARLMEYSGLLEKTQGELWRERRFFAGAMLRSTITNATNAQPSNADIDGIITEYSTWMIDLFTANAIQDSQKKLQEKDKLKDYVESFCTGLFDNADKAIVKVRPDLFIGVKAENPNSATPSLLSEDQTKKLLQENIKLQQAIKQLEGQVTAQDKALKMAEAKAEIAEQMLKDQVVETEKQKSANGKKTTSETAQEQTPSGSSQDGRDDTVDAQLTETLSPPPQKPPLPLNLAAQDGEVIATRPTLAPEDVGLTQVQLASYSSIKNAENGLNILSKQMPQNLDVSHLDSQQ